MTCLVMRDDVLLLIHIAQAGADLGKTLTDLLQNECRRRKLLGVTGTWSPEIFSILTT